MSTLTIHTDSGIQSFAFVLGQSLSRILDAVGVPVRAGCRGVGACGLCLVRIVAGDVGASHPNEGIFLDDDHLAQGIRLACQVVPEDDLEIVILSPAPKSTWRRLIAERGQRTKRSIPYPLNILPPNITTPYGVAIDLGTTHISLSLYNLSDGTWVTGRHGRNPQASVGADVVTRLMAAIESPAQAQALSQRVIDAICEALWDLVIRDGINLQHVVRLTLVGNTAMLALLAGRNFDLLLQPSHWMRAIDCAPRDTAAWITAWGIHPQAQIDVAPVLAGFVGSDLLAGVIATKLTEGQGRSLLVDFGTNSEIALWDGTVLWTTSAAGGPAFEGSGIRCGMPAEAGAIYQITMHADILECAVIGGGQPYGICGSGLVDLIACLMRSGKLMATGKFTATVPSQGFTLVHGEQRIRVPKTDIDVFQRAKAAIGVGIQVLLDQAGLRAGDLQRICVGGAFGRSLNIRNAQEVGLLPNVPFARVELCGNMALAGCEEALLSPLILESMQRIGDQARIINLSQYSDFDILFLENLYLQPV
ncbi:MAG: ASKHA domain-containing protein [Chloroflexales bacterium]